MTSNASSPIDYGVISADSHVIEPHDLWQRLVPSKFRDRAPRLVSDKDTDRFECDQADLPPVGLLAGCARGDDDVRTEGRWDEDVFVGGYDPKVRLADLERDGVTAEILYPTIAMQLYPIEDVEFQNALFQAYNTWLAEEFCAAYPERFKGIAMLNPEDVPGSLAEIERAAKLGLAGVMVPLYLGESQNYAEERFDPLWAAAVDHDLPVNLHAATTRDRSRAWNKGTPTDAILSPVQIQRALLDMVMKGLFDRFPKLMVVSAESDVGWAGNVIERADFWFRRGQRIMEATHGTSLRHKPSHYFRNNVRITFMRDRTAVLARDVIGVETMMWGNDFPHHVSTWPESRKVLDEHFADTPPEVRDRVVRDNVRELYRF
jgi:predicted TIM-barrel fold metal-dependent hydrolase